MDLTPPSVDDYVRTLLARHDEPVLLEMEAEAERSGFPIVGRHVGVVLELLARSIGARRVFELGSGFGYSAYWFSRAVGNGGEVHLTDTDPANERKATEYLRRAGLDGPATFHLGSAVEQLEATEGEFDVIFSDIDKDGYPAAWRAAGERIRTGGLYICDNTIQAGGMNVVTMEGTHAAAVREHNEAVFADERYVATILPIRDGVLVASKIR